MNSLRIVINFSYDLCSCSRKNVSRDKHDNKKEKEKINGSYKCVHLVLTSFTVAIIYNNIIIILYCAVPYCHNNNSTETHSPSMYLKRKPYNLAGYSACRVSVKTFF